MDEKITPITQEIRYAGIIEKWKAFWNLEDLERPLWMFLTAPGLTPPALGEVSIPLFMKDKNIQLQEELKLLQRREKFSIQDDFVPHLQPQQGVTVFASAFGCLVDYDHGLPWASPIIRQDDLPRKVYELPIPNVTDGQLGDMLKFTDYFVKETKGRYPIALTDLQGPLDTAYLIWEPTSFMMAMYDHPKEVHRLMRLVTDLIIKFVKEQRARCPEFIPCHFPPIYLPDGKGIAISDDCLDVLNSELYEKFALPYVNELSEEFGGILIHSCGNFVHQFDNLKKIHNLRGINFGATETPFDAVWENFGGKIAIIPHLGLNKKIHFSTSLEYVEYILKRKTTNRGLCILIDLPKKDNVVDLNFDRTFIAKINYLIERYS